MVYSLIKGFWKVWASHLGGHGPEIFPLSATRLCVLPNPGPLLGGSWDLVSKVINKVTILIITYIPN